MGNKQDRKKLINENLLLPEKLEKYSDERIMANVERGKKLRHQKSLSLIQDFQKVHGDTYDYSKVEYFDSVTDIKIICKKHGIFLQAPKTHQRGSGCQKCGKVLLLNQAQVIKEFKITHGDKYDYSKVKYKNHKTKVEIICKMHGIFLQNPQVHKGGSGCPKCSRKISAGEMIIQLKAVHGNEYDYSKIKNSKLGFLNTKDKVEIICKKHGSFWQFLYIHKSGNKCPACAQEHRNESLQIVADRQRHERSQNIVSVFKKIHGNKYDYSRVKYSRAIDKVEIGCKKHGIFLQSPMTHKSGSGCPKCAIERIAKMNTKT